MAIINPEVLLHNVLFLGPLRQVTIIISERHKCLLCLYISVCHVAHSWTCIIRLCMVLCVCTCSLRHNIPMYAQLPSFLPPLPPPVYQQLVYSVDSSTQDLGRTVSSYTESQWGLAQISLPKEGQTFSGSKPVVAIYSMQNIHNTLYRGMYMHMYNNVHLLNNVNWLSSMF